MRDLHVKKRPAQAPVRNKVKKQRKPINWRPLVTAASRAICGATLLALVGFVGYHAYGYVTRITFLSLEKVEVTGLRRLKKDDLIAEAGVKPGDPMLGLKLARIGEQLAKNPWIERVRVRRYFPHTLAIELEEREPAAVVSMGVLYYLDKKGNVFKPLNEGDRLDFPVVTGISEEDLAKDPAGSKASLKRALELMDTLGKGTALSLADISEIHLDKGFGITLFTVQGGVPVRLGNTGFEEKLGRLARIFQELQTQLAGVEYIDLDYSDKIIVKKG